jgi:hypothetical protein
MALEVRDYVRLCVLAIEKGPNTWDKAVKERGWQNTPGRYRLGREKNIPARYGYW